MRPTLHLTAERGWINDPHGITYRDGRYHLFHQYVPDSLTHRPGCHWGHAVSDDLLTWERRPVALAPGEGDDGIWTGSLVVTGDAPSDAVILYTSVLASDYGMGRVRLASPTDDDWDVWAKGEIVVEPPAELDLIAFRDPFVVPDGDGWRMFVGGATRSGDALAIGYTSDDLTTWRYDGVAAGRSTHEREPVWMGALWECPQLVAIDGRGVMVSSVWDDDVLHYVGYGVGTLDGGRFRAQDWGRLTFGSSYYAPSFFRDADGEPCLMFWMRGVMDEAAGWASCLSVPYRLGVVNDRLVATPHPALAAARGEPWAPGAEIGGPIDAVWSPVSPGSAVVLSAHDGEVARIVVERTRLVLERQGEPAWSMPYTGGPIRLILDGPALEIATGDGVLGAAVSPAVGLATSGGSATDGGELQVWPVLTRVRALERGGSPTGRRRRGDARSGS